MGFEWKKIRPCDGINVVSHEESKPTENKPIKDRVNGMLLWRRYVLSMEFRQFWLDLYI